MNASAITAVTVGKIIIASTIDAASTVCPVGRLNISRIKGTSTVSAVQPYTTEGIPAKIPIIGFIYFSPFFLSVTDMYSAVAIENGATIRTDARHTATDPVMNTLAPTFPPPNSVSEGFHADEKINSPIV